MSESDSANGDGDGDGEQDTDEYERATATLDVSGAWDVPDGGDGDSVGESAEALPDADMSGEASIAAGSTGSVPVDREYDFSKAIPTDVPEFKSSGGIMRRIRTDLANRHESGRNPRYLIGGPTSAGKSLLGEHMAANELVAPRFTVQCDHGMKQSSLIGKMAYVDDETKWVDSTLIHALLASQEGPVVVIIDEMNRAPSKYKDVFFPFLDDRCRVQIPERGNEVIQGVPENLIVFATINEGAGYVGTETIDMAELRRYGHKHNVDYIGVDDPALESELITERTHVPQAYADRLVSIANDIRREARSANTSLSMGLPTGTVLDWARTAWMYEADDEIDGDGIPAAEDTFIDLFYDGDQEAKDFVVDAVTDGLGGVGVFGADSTGDDGNAPDAPENAEIYCSSCEFAGEHTDVSDDDLTFMSCPNCDDGTLIFEDGK